DHDVHREIQCLDEGRDRCRVGQAHRIDTIGPGVSVGDPPPDGFLEPRLIISLRVTERVRAGIDHEGDRLGSSECLEGLQFPQLTLERQDALRRMIEVFEVDPDRAGLENALHHGHDLARRRPEPADDVRAQRYRQRASDPLGGRHEFLAFDHLTVRVTEGDHDPRARGGDRGKTFVLKDACTWHVPSVGKDEEFLASMEFPEFLGPSSLVLHDDRPPGSDGGTTCSTSLPRVRPRRPRSNASRARGSGNTASTTGRIRPASTSPAISTSWALFGCTNMETPRTPNFAAIASGASPAIVTRTPPGRNTPQDRSRVSPPTVSMTASTPRI